MTDTTLPNVFFLLVSGGEALERSSSDPEKEILIGPSCDFFAPSFRFIGGPFCAKGTLPLPIFLDPFPRVPL